MLRLERRKGDLARGAGFYFSSSVISSSSASYASKQDGNSVCSQHDFFKYLASPFLSLSLLLLLSLCLSLATPFIRISTMNYVYFSYFSLRSRPSNIRTRLCASMPYFSRYNIIENQIPTYRVCSKQFKRRLIIRTWNVKQIEGILFTEWNTDVASQKYSVRVRSSYDSIRLASIIFHPWLPLYNENCSLYEKIGYGESNSGRWSASEDMKFQPIPRRFSIPGPNKCILFSRSNRLRQTRIAREARVSVLLLEGGNCWNESFGRSIVECL